MKEHPDYKYRPRRKPKPLVQKKESVKFSTYPVEAGRSLLAPPPPLLETGSELKLPLLPPFHYPLYDSKLAADLALHAFYGKYFPQVNNYMYNLFILNFYILFLFFLLIVVRIGIAHVQIFHYKVLSEMFILRSP